jgi:hypothetical protein
MIATIVCCLIVITMLLALGLLNINIKETPKMPEMIQVGDKVIAVGRGTRTKTLNNGDIVRSRGRGGFQELVNEQVVMTVTSVYGDTVKTKYYTFHKDDVHAIDNDNDGEVPTVFCAEGEYTAAELRAKLAQLN